MRKNAFYWGHKEHFHNGKSVTFLTFIMRYYPILRGTNDLSTISSKKLFDLIHSTVEFMNVNYFQVLILLTLFVNPFDYSSIRYKYMESQPYISSIVHIEDRFPCQKVPRKRFLLTHTVMPHLLHVQCI